MAAFGKKNFGMKQKKRDKDPKSEAGRFANELRVFMFGSPSDFELRISDL
jgi:hypothetical protein